MYECPAISLQALHDESFASEQADTELSLESNADADALGGRKKRIFLSNQFSANLTEVDRDDLSRIGRAERQLTLPTAAIQEDRHEQGFSGEQSFSRTEQRAEKSGVLL